MTDDYIQIGSISTEIGALRQQIERLILNGDNDEVNAYLKKAAAEIQYAIAHLKNAMFEAISSPELNEEIRKQEKQAAISYRKISHTTSYRLKNS